MLAGKQSPVSKNNLHTLRSFSQSHSVLPSLNPHSIPSLVKSPSTHFPITKFASTYTPRTPRSLACRRLAPISLTPVNSIPKLHNSLTASGSNGVIKSYAANSHVGLIRKANEDRVAINYRVSKPAGKVCEVWPVISYFGVFDGHGGSFCAEFLRDNLLDFILKQVSFPGCAVDAIKQGFAEAEATFLQLAEKKFGDYDHSGSCANVVIIIDDSCYVANVGDSRAIMSVERGTRLHELSRDHKPNLETEKARIESVGARVYCCGNSSPSSHASGDNEKVYRVMPGRLAISRTFGDADAKLPCFGGITGAVIAEPDIKSFRMSRKYDFIIMASDGIYDKLSNSDVIRTAWSAIDSYHQTLHGACGEAVKRVMEEALLQQSLDNVTVVLVAFKPLRDAYSEKAMTSR